MKSLDDARTSYGNGYYRDKLEQGLVFQDIVTRALYARGIVVVGYASQRFQVSHGENMLGAEIKNDALFRETGNLYIEMAEKSHPDKQHYTDSGICRKDNSWLYVIGDEITCWIFSTKFLGLMAHRYLHKITPTSKGFLLPMQDADKYCVRRLELTETGDTGAK